MSLRVHALLRAGGIQSSTVLPKFDADLMVFVAEPYSELRRSPYSTCTTMSLERRTRTSSSTNPSLPDEALCAIPICSFEVLV